MTTRDFSYLVLDQWWDVSLMNGGLGTCGRGLRMIITEQVNPSTFLVQGSVMAINGICLSIHLCLPWFLCVNWWSQNCLDLCQTARKRASCQPYQKWIRSDYILYLECQLLFHKWPFLWFFSPSNLFFTKTCCKLDGSVPNLFCL